MNDEVMDSNFPLMRIFEATVRPSRLADDFETVVAPAMRGSIHARAPLMRLAGRPPRPLCMARIARAAFLVGIAQHIR